MLKQAPKEDGPSIMSNRAIFRCFTALDGMFSHYAVHDIGVPTVIRRGVSTSGPTVIWRGVRIF